MPSRQSMWQQLPEQTDVLIIGGGIVGAGVARDAALRGLKVVLVEMDDLASGTSSRSSKLIHGGLRYLETYEFSLVFESVSERRILLDLAPHLVNPLAFLFPVYRGSRRNLWMISAGMWIYDGLSLFRSPKKHRRLRPSEVQEVEPILKRENLQGAPLYYDCSTDDARLTIESAISATQNGAVIATQCRADALLKDEQGRVNGVVVRDRRSQEIREVRAHAVINATGPWTDETLAMSRPSTQKLLRETKGVHIVVDRERLPVQHVVVCFHPTDDRVLFALPWGDRTYVGTTDTDWEGGDPAQVAATSEDVDYLIDAANAHFPDHQIGRDDVISTWAGLRPLIAPDAEHAGVAESKISREHHIVVGEDGLITVAGGKLTTFRKMAAEVVDTAVQLLTLSDRLAVEPAPSSSAKALLPGAVDWPADDDHERVAAAVEDASNGRLSKETARLLADTYGMRSLEIARRCVTSPELAKPLIEGRPEIMAQVEWAVAEEFAATVTDVFIRRTQLFYRDVDQGLGAVDKVADFMADLIGWTLEEKQASIAAYHTEVARSRQWRNQG